MGHYEYHVIPAPGRADKVRGARTVADRFAATLAQAMNALAVEGWEYVRADTLPCEDKGMFRGTSTHVHHLLVFRRYVMDQADARAFAAPAAAAPGAPALRAAWDDQAATAPALGPAVSR